MEIDVDVELELEAELELEVDVLKSNVRGFNVVLYRVELPVYQPLLL